MASAVLANRNSEPKFMGKLPFSNPNPKFSKKRAPPPAAVVHVDESPAVTQSAASDDASSINHHRRPHSHREIVPGGGGGGYVTFNISAYSKKDLLELKNQLVVELEQIRQLKNRIESADFNINNHQIIRSNGKKQIPTNSKKISGNKRPSYPDSKPRPNNTEYAQLMKNCGSILTKLMKVKHGYVFNAPVDVIGLNLHDYNDIIKSPMDLGTVKSKLGKNVYDSPRGFAADVRLTFNNAMRYNPKGHEVYILAEQLMAKFEELYRPIREKIGDEDVDVDELNHEQIQEVQASSWDHRDRIVVQEKENENRAVQVREKPEQIGNLMPVASGLNQNNNSNVNMQSSVVQLPVRTPSPMRVPPVKPLKQPKPKAKDPNKREMSLEEKHKLGLGLQSLPQEKMEQVVQIIKKRNGHLRQEGDEIELDIEAVDTETLWELDRFVTNYKKMVSKIKRQALMGINTNNVAMPASEPIKDVVPGIERMEVGNEAKKLKKGDAGDEDVDIGDEMPMGSFPPVEIEKDNGHASSSSSSSSSSSDDSSSSSDSDSGSSSGSDSEDAHS